MKILISLGVFIGSIRSVHAHAEGSSSAELFGMDAAHLHLLSNHVPIFITLSGLIALVLALFWKNDVSKKVALILLVIGSLGGVVTYWFGESAYKSVRGLADDVGQDWLDLHMERAEKVLWLLWTSLIGGLGALVALWKRHRSARFLVLLSGLLAAALLGAAGWIADAGGKIRHPELRGTAKEVPESMETHTH